MPSLATLLAGGGSKRAAAYSTLEQTQDAALGASCVEALLGTLGKPESEVDAAEWRRCALVLAHLAQLDVTRVTREYFMEMRYASTIAKGNALDVALSQPPELITRDVARTAAAGGGRGSSAFAALMAKGFDPMMAAAGVDARGLYGAWDGQDCAYNDMLKDEAKRLRLLKLTLELLQEDRAELSETEAAGAWRMLAELMDMLPPLYDISISRLHAAHCAQAGATALAVAELRTGAPAEWVSVTKNSSGRFCSALYFISRISWCLAPEDRHLVATPQLLDVFLDGLKAFEAAGSAEVEHANITSVYVLLLGLYLLLPALFAVSDVNRVAVRGVASSIRFVLDHPLPWATEFSATTNMVAVRIIARSSILRLLSLLAWWVCLRGGWFRRCSGGTRTAV